MFVVGRCTESVKVQKEKGETERERRNVNKNSNAMMHGSTMRPVAHCGGTLRLKGISNLHQKKSFRCKPNLHRIAAQRPTLDTEVPRLDAAVDDSLSNRPLALDSGGYFIIKLDRENREIVADFYTNIINKNGR